MSNETVRCQNQLDHHSNFRPCVIHLSSFISFLALWTFFICLFIFCLAPKDLLQSWKFSCIVWCFVIFWWFIKDFGFSLHDAHQKAPLGFMHSFIVVVEVGFGVHLVLAYITIVGLLLLWIQAVAFLVLDKPVFCLHKFCHTVCTLYWCNPNLTLSTKSFPHSLHINWALSISLILSNRSKHQIIFRLYFFHFLGEGGQLKVPILAWT